jgi:hypothetical protein
MAPTLVAVMGYSDIILCPKIMIPSPFFSKP